MNILPLIVVAIGSFCAGSFLIFKGYQQDAETPAKDQEPGVVPISDPKEIDELKQNFVAVTELQEKHNTQVKEINQTNSSDTDAQTENPPVQENQRPTLSILQETSHEQETELRHQLDQIKYRIKEQEEASKAKILELTEDNRKLEDALKRELDSKEPIDGLKEKEDLEERLIQAESLMKSLTEENRSYNEQIQDQADEINMLKNEIQSIQSTDHAPRVDAQELKAKEEKLLEAEGSIIRLMAENQRLTEQIQTQTQEMDKLHSENKSYKDTIEENNKHDPQVLMKMEEKLTEVQQTNTQLTEENQRLTSQIQQQIDRINELTSNTELIRNRFAEIEANEKIKTEALLHELETQKQQIYEERQSDLAAIDKLRNEKQDLVDREEHSKERAGLLELKIKEMNSSFLEEVAKQKLEIKAEHAALIQQLNQQLVENKKKLVENDEQIQFLKHSYENKINELNAELDSLKSAVNSASDSTAEMAELKTKCEKLSSNNEHLLEKEKMLVYELSKSRAQALGLERICKDFKRQLDQGSGRST